MELKKEKEFQLVKKNLSGKGKNPTGKRTMKERTVEERTMEERTTEEVSIRPSQSVSSHPSQFPPILEKGIPVKIKKLKKGAIIPVYQTSGAVGFDFYSLEEMVIEPGKRKLIGTGLAMALPEGVELQIRPRSGLAYREGLTILNSPGTVDSDYRGEIKILVVNLGDKPIKILKGERIAQGIIAPIFRAQFQPVEELPTTVRGGGGFGSTGR